MLRVFLIAIAMFASSALSQEDKKTPDTDQSTESIKLPEFVQGEQGGLPKRGFRILSKAADYEAFVKLMKEKKQGDKLPEIKDIDFSKQRVLVADYGTAETFKGIYPIALFRKKDGKLHVRYEFSSFQVVRFGDAPIPTYHAWSAMVVPLNEKGYVVETNHQRLKSGPELWTADAELKP